MHDCQPQPSTDLANAPVALVQGGSVEGNSEIRLGQAGTAVAYLGYYRRLAGSGVRGTNRQDDRRTSGSDPQRVLEQTVQNLPHPVRIGMGHRREAGYLQHELNAGRFASRLPYLTGRSRHLGQIDGRQIDPKFLGIQPRQIQQIGNQAVQSLRFGQHDRADLSGLSWLHHSICQGLGEASDRGQWRAQIMRYRKQKVALPGL